MRTTTAAWRLAARNNATRSQVSAGYQPIWLVEILGVNLCYTTAPVYFSRQRALGDGLVFGNGATLGGFLPAYGRDLAQGGIGEVSTQLSDDFTRVQVGNMRATLLNQEGLLRDLTGVILDNAVVRLRLGFEGLGYDDFLELWLGAVDRLEDRQDIVVLECIDNSFTRYPSLSQPLSPQYFPATPQANKSRAIPLLLGRNTDVETIRISGAAQGTLAFAISSGATALLLKEFGAPFPAAGSLTVGTETSITYTSRTLVTNPTNGLTSLQLSGLVRSGTPASHAVGEAVTLVSPVYDYLTGYKIADLQAVRGAGAIIGSGSYTLLEQQATAPVSVIRFTSAPTEPVTVDVNAGSVDATNLLANGGFETGSLSGYTVGSGATASVGTSAPTPEEGTYRASLQGTQDTYKDLYQDVSTIAGSDYILQFSRQDADTTLLTNGGWESNNFSGWTLTYTEGAVHFGIGDAAEPFTSPFPQNGAARLLSSAADGRYALLVGPAIGHSAYELILVQDFTTSVSTTYTASLQHITQDIRQFFGGGSGTQLFATRIQSYVTLAIGTTTNPNSLITERQIPASNVFFNGNGPGLAYAKSPAYTFVATATTTRLTIRCVGLGQPAPVGGGLILPPPLLLDAIRVQNASEIDTSNVGIQIGTTADSDSIYAADLPATYVWTPERIRFRATEGTTRITWQSRYTTTVARASFLDTMSLQRVYVQGYNPIEQIRSIIRTFLPQFTVDESSFLTAYDRRVQWQFGTVLTTPGDSRALLARMAEQCGCLLFESAGATLKIITRDTNRSPVFGFNNTNVVQGSFRAVPEQLDNVYTEIYVWFGARTGGSTQAADFAASTYCTPAMTTHPLGQGLIALCQAAEMNYKRPRRLDFFADFVQDIQTANLLLSHLVQARTIRQVVVDFATWIDAAALELGDLVAIEDPRYPGTSAVLDYEIVGLQQPTPENPYVQITARSFRQGGWSAGFDYLSFVVEGMGFEDHFES
jgi:hypothetical protein